MALRSLLDSRVRLDSKSSKEPGSSVQKNLWSGLQDVCNLLNVPLTVLPQHAGIAFQHLYFKQGQAVYRSGQMFEYLFVVNSGFMKAALLDDGGEEQVLSFPMKGDLLGVDGIHSGRYVSEATALSACDIILLPFKAFSQLGRTYPELGPALYGVISRELVREQAVLSMLGGLHAEARVARFLVMQAERYARLGYSAAQFDLRMSRREIGSYLGLTLETVSRTFSALSAMGLIRVDQRAIQILDHEALRTLKRLPPAFLRSCNERYGARHG